SAPGCTILVKLWQFDPSDRTHVVIDTNKMPFIDAPARQGVEIMPLFRDGREDVRLERWAPGAEVLLDGHDGFEAFVLDGSFEEGGETFEKDSWLRLPQSTPLSAKTGPSGAKIWIKTAHLARPQLAPPQ
ncbi:MAG: cupin domain-containing protein, partial [Pseudomonadota bacterium]